MAGVLTEGKPRTAKKRPTPTMAPVKVPAGGTRRKPREAPRAAAAGAAARISHLPTSYRPPGASRQDAALGPKESPGREAGAEVSLFPVSLGTTLQNERDLEVDLVAGDVAVLDQHVLVLDPGALYAAQGRGSAADGLLDGILEACLRRRAQFRDAGYRHMHSFRISIPWSSYYPKGRKLNTSGRGSGVSRAPGRAPDRRWARPIRRRVLR